MKYFSAQAGRMVLGIDLGDRKSEYVLLDESGTEMESGGISAIEKWMRILFENTERCRVVMEL